MLEIPSRGCREASCTSLTHSFHSGLTGPRAQSSGATGPPSGSDDDSQGDVHWRGLGNQPKASRRRWFSGWSSRSKAQQWRTLGTGAGGSLLRLEKGSQGRWGPHGCPYLTSSCGSPILEGTYLHSKCVFSLFAGLKEKVPGVSGMWAISLRMSFLRPGSGWLP